MAARVIRVMGGDGGGSLGGLSSADLDKMAADRQLSLIAPLGARRSSARTP